MKTPHALALKPVSTAARSAGIACAGNVLALLLLTLPMVVEAQFTYQTINGTITISGYTGPGGAVTIPSEIDGFPVTQIGKSAFSGSYVTDITIPDGVTSLGDESFYYCTALTNAVLPNGITNIGTAAFLGCFKLRSVTIPDRVTELEDHVFQGCTGLTNLTLGKSLTRIGGCAFCMCSGLKSLLVPGSVTNIGAQAFDRCSGLLSVTVGHGVRVVGYLAFQSCSSLTNLTLGNTVTTIEKEAFLKCSSLSSVALPSTVTLLASGAFSYCTSLSDVFFEGNAPCYTSSDAFWGDSHATVFHLPGTTGWGTTFGGCPTALWVLPYPVILANGSNFGVQTNGFGFTISWATNTPVVVEASTGLFNPTWTPLATNTLSGGSSYFTDPEWTNSPSRFYRVRSP